MPASSSSSASSPWPCSASGSLLDPDPRAIVNEFVLKENAGKFAAPGGYLKNFFWGGSSIWRLVVSYPLNAGLLMFPVVARRSSSRFTPPRPSLSDEETLLWMWVITLFVVFSLPSQRDERYLLPAMPALAVLCALNWERISDRAFKASSHGHGRRRWAAGVSIVAARSGVPGGRLYPIAYWALLTTAAARRQWSRSWRRS